MEGKRFSHGQFWYVNSTVTKILQSKLCLLKVNEQIILLKLPEFLSYLFLLLNQIGDPVHFHHSGEKGGRGKIIKLLKA